MSFKFTFLKTVIGFILGIPLLEFIINLPVFVIAFIQLAFFSCLYHFIDKLREKWLTFVDGDVK